MPLSLTATALLHDTTHNFWLNLCGQERTENPPKNKSSRCLLLDLFSKFWCRFFLKRFNVCFLPKREEEDGEVTQINKNKLRSLTLAANLNTVSKQSEAPTPNTQRTIQSLRSRPFILSKWLIKIWEDNNKTEKKENKANHENDLVVAVGDHNLFNFKLELSKYNYKKILIVLRSNHKSRLNHSYQRALISSCPHFTYTQ